MKAIYQVSTGKFLEAQSSASEETLRKNVYESNPNIAKDDLEVRDITPEQLNTIIKETAPTAPDASDIDNLPVSGRAIILAAAALSGKSAQDAKNAYRDAYDTVKDNPTRGRPA